MKILNCLAVASMVLMYSCSKGVPEGSYVNVSVVVANRTEAALLLSTDGGQAQALAASGTNVALLAGKHRLAVSEAGRVLLDTAIDVPPTALLPARQYAVLRSSPSAKLQLWSDDYLGMDTVPAPPAGYFTISVTNIAPQLPAMVDVHFYVNTATGADPQQVETGVIKGVGRNAASGFVPMRIGRNDNGTLLSPVAVEVRDPNTGNVLLSDNFQLTFTVLGFPTPHYVYTACLSGSGFDILLEK